MVRARYAKLYWSVLSLMALGILIFVLNIAFPLSTAVDYSTVISTRDGSVAHAFLSKKDKWRMQSKLSEISLPLRKIVIAKEDQYFYYHFGINPLAILRALFLNTFYQKKTSGASTINMQVARLLEPKRRSYFNKFLEIGRALQLEWYLTKDEILELYLNLVPYGGNIEGVKSASVLYFGKAPDHISLAQSVVLSIVPNRPTSWSVRKNSNSLLIARNKWLQKFRKAGLFADAEIDDALREPMHLRRLASPREIPHLARRLKNQFPQQANIQTTINFYQQKSIEQIVHTYAQRVASLQIRNAAVLVLDNTTHEVVCYVGSQDFNDAKYGGQVDGVLAGRSPGSTLKPFVYGQSFDKGLATPKTIVTDVPTDFDGYAPENFDKKFNGAVTVEKSLAYSLNIPAVKTLLSVGKTEFIHLLKKANFKTVKKQEHRLGLSLILGGCSVTLEELTALYSSLASEGRYYPIKYLMTDRKSLQGLPLLSSGSVYMISGILSQTTRPDLPHGAESNLHLPKIAWKTGTSYGRKDAWCIGYNSKYTVGVWLGNFNGQGVPELTGADIATPLLFSIFNYIDYNSTAFNIAKPSTMAARFVCKETGQVAEEWCEKPIIDFYMPGISSPAKCAHQQWKWVSPNESMRYCSHCLPVGGYKRKLYSNLPSELISYYEQQHTPYIKMPPHNPRCTYVSNNPTLRIVSPLANKKIYIEKGDDTELMLKCETNSEIHTVYWYINDSFLQSSPSQSVVFFKPDEGNLKISCTDDKGNASTINLEVFYQ